MDEIQILKNDRAELRAQLDSLWADYFVVLNKSTVLETENAKLKEGRVEDKHAVYLPRKNGGFQLDPTTPVVLKSGKELHDFDPVTLAYDEMLEAREIYFRNGWATEAFDALIKGCEPGPTLVSTPPQMIYMEAVNAENEKLKKEITRLNWQLRFLAAGKLREAGAKGTDGTR